MLKINEILKKYDIKPRKYEKNKKTTIIETDQNKYVLKQKKQNKEIFDYLATRNFDYIPKSLNDENDDYEITPYIDSYNIPPEQKIMDLIDIVSLLHNKTTHYKEVTEDDYKTIYEDIRNNIEYLYTYYMDIITIIETKIFMSPSEYLLARNISKIFEILNITKNKLEQWIKEVKIKTKQRYVVLHNNLDLDHFLINKRNYLISWDKSKIDIPIFDIYKLYKKYCLDFEFDVLLKRYESNYPLSNDERNLLFILISLPDKIEFVQTEYENTKKIGKMIDYIYKTENQILPYYSNEGEKNNS